MKYYNITTTTLYLFVSLILFSCLKEDLQDRSVIIDPVYEWDYIAVWEEYERQIGDSDPEVISDGNRISLWLEDTISSEIISDGIYTYSPVNLEMPIDTIGMLFMKDGILTFVNIRDDFKLRLEFPVRYTLQDIILAIRDTSVTPYVEVRYYKVE